MGKLVAVAVRQSQSRRGQIDGDFGAWILDSHLAVASPTVTGSKPFSGIALEDVGNLGADDGAMPCPAMPRAHVAREPQRSCVRPPRPGNPAASGRFKMKAGWSAVRKVAPVGEQPACRGHPWSSSSRTALE